MKCDHLIGRKFNGEVYILASDVMEAVAELKEFAEDVCLERDDNQTAIDELQAENAELKAIRKRLEEANEKVEKLNDTLYNEWKFLFKKWCGIEKEADDEV